MQSYVQRAKKHTASPDIVQAVRSSGRPRAIPEPVREKMGASFGMDFSGVRIYESPLVGQQGAEAAAMGNEIAFAPGKFNMGSFSGQALLGHELAHIGQQARGEVSGGGLVRNSSFEHQADVQGMMAARGETAAPASGAQIAPMSAAPLSGSEAAVQPSKKEREMREKMIVENEKSIATNANATSRNASLHQAAVREQAGFKLNRDRPLMINALMEQGMSEEQATGATELSAFSPFYATVGGQGATEEMSAGQMGQIISGLKSGDSAQTSASISQMKDYYKQYIFGLRDKYGAKLEQYTPGDYASTEDKYAKVMWDLRGAGAAKQMAGLFSSHLDPEDQSDQEFAALAKYYGSIATPIQDRIAKFTGNTETHTTDHALERDRAVVDQEKADLAEARQSIRSQGIRLKRRSLKARLRDWIHHGST